MGLLGVSSKPLAIFLEEVRRLLPELGPVPVTFFLCAAAK